MAKVSSAPWQAGTVSVRGDDACEWQGDFGCRESTWSMILLLRGIYFSQWSFWWFIIKVDENII